MLLSLGGTVCDMSHLRKAFGKAVRRLRDARGYSQETFAAKSKIDRSYAGKIERGEVNVSLDNIQKIAKALGLTPGALMVEADSES
jgi:transcriptional regulator with XRE-family HTH domain